jgi:hypothetical protein
MFAVGGFRLAGCSCPLEGPLQSPFPSGFSNPDPPAGSTWGSPLRRIATLASEFRHAMKNSPSHRLRLLFSGRCCAKNTQLVPPRCAAYIARARRSPKFLLMKQWLNMALGDRERNPHGKPMKMPFTHDEPSRSVCKRPSSNFSRFWVVAKANPRRCFSCCTHNESLKRDAASEHLRHESHAHQIFVHAEMADGKFDGTRINAAAISDAFARA